MKCELKNQYTKEVMKPETRFLDWIENSPLTKSEQTTYRNWLSSEGSDMKDALNAYFSNDALKDQYTPLWIYHEGQNALVTLLINQSDIPSEPGESGSILSYARAYGFDAQFLCSDCYGQLSCSSCAVEILSGNLENPTPKEEEYDMLDIDSDRPPTQYTRLSCQAVLGTEPVFVKLETFNKKGKLQNFTRFYTTIFLCFFLY